MFSEPMMVYVPMELPGLMYAMLSTVPLMMPEPPKPAPLDTVNNGVSRLAVNPQQAGFHGGVCRERVGASQIPAVGILVSLHGQDFKVEEVVTVAAMPLEKRCVDAGATNNVTLNNRTGLKRHCVIGIPQ